MRKTVFACLLCAAAVALSGCGAFHAHIDAPDPGTDYFYVSDPASASRPSETEAPLTDATLPTAPVQPTAPAPSAPVYVQPQSQPQPTAPAENPEAGTSAAPQTSAPAATAPYPSAPADVDPSEGEIDLSISMPSPNGKMEVSSDPSNRFISAVRQARGTDPALTVAVYAVPASGQNYVFEFYSASERTAQNLRRVYLLSDGGEIVSVAAANGAEAENLSATENWFCFTVLIKGMVFPAVKNQF